MATDLAIKVDVDTERGTRIGVPRLCGLFAEHGIRATFLFSLGPDNTGRAIRRVFRPGFLAKTTRTNVLGVYGLRTLMNGILWPGPHIASRHSAILRATRDAGHEVGIHCHDHVRWQDGLARMKREEVAAEFARAAEEFRRVFGEPARVAGAAGWQANEFSLQAYDAAGVEYASDCRGSTPFRPRVFGRTFRAPQVPTTLPTLDELLGRPEFPIGELAQRYLSWLRPDRVNVLTVHAEIEGMAQLEWFAGFLAQARRAGVRFLRLADVAHSLRSEDLPVCDLIVGRVEGRSGTLALQGC